MSIKKTEVTKYHSFSIYRDSKGTTGKTTIKKYKTPKVKRQRKSLYQVVKYMEHYEWSGIMRKLSWHTVLRVLLWAALFGILFGCGPSKNFSKGKWDLEAIKNTRIYNQCTGASMTVGETAATLTHLLKENPTTWVYTQDLCSLDPTQYRQRQAQDALNFDALVDVYGTNNMYYMLHKDTCLVPSMSQICDSLRAMSPETPWLQALKCFCTVNMMTAIAAWWNMTPIDFNYSYPSNRRFNMDAVSNQQQFQGIQGTSYFQTTTTTYRWDEVTIWNPTISPDDYAELAREAQQGSVDAIQVSGTTVSLAHDIQCPIHITFQPIVTSAESHGVDPYSYSYNLPASSHYTIMNDSDAANASMGLQDMFQSIKTNNMFPVGTHINIAVSYHTDTGIAWSTRIVVK